MSLTTRVRQTTTTTGTGDLVLGSAPATYVTYASIYADGTWVPYTAIGGAQFEEGVAPVSAGTLQRSLGRVFFSSAGGDLVDFEAGTKTVDGFLGNHEVATRLAAEKTAAGGGGGGGGDASAANQATQIGIETAIRDRVTAFVPGATASAACSSTALAAVAVTAGAVVRFGNAGTAAIGVAFGDSGIAGTITATTAIDILPGTAEAFTVPAGVTHFSAIMASGTGTLKYTIGTGS